MRGALQRLAGIIALGMGLHLQQALAQSASSGRIYPDKPVRVVVGQTVGGLPDTVARLVAPKLSERWGFQVYVENKPGANGNIGADFVAKAAPDGYTLLATGNSIIAVNPFLYSKMPFDPYNDLVAVSLTARAPLFLAVHSSVPASSLQELIALAKSRPGELAYGSSGIGSIHHLSMEYLKSALGMDITHVPFKGTGQSVPATVAGQVAMVFSAYPSLFAYAKDGRMKLLGVNSLKRPGFAPNIPTIAETVPGYDFATTIGFLAPVGTPKEVVAKISASLAEVARNPDIVTRMTNLGIEAAGTTPGEYADSLKADAERFSKAVKLAGVKAE